ncbi:hypothetical protein KFE98_00455 [bacterium SCSIO 12741]|nr:hypothetical protein KFE98_00455 [bacterium SCSIO 12741]
MKHTITIIVFLISLSGCQPNQTNANDYMNEIRKDFAKHAERHNQKVLAWDSKIQELYRRSDANLKDGVIYADSLIENDKSLDDSKVSILHAIVGEIYYDNDSIALAMERFQLNELLTFDSPRNQANKAGCYIKQGDFDKAMALLAQAAEVNPDFKWYIGNLYEIQGNPEKAISEYQYVYQQDTVVYSFYYQRIQELENNPDQLLTELYYKDRRKRNYLLYE